MCELNVSVNFERLKYLRRVSKDIFLEHQDKLIGEEVLPRLVTDVSDLFKTNSRVALACIGHLWNTTAGEKELVKTAYRLAGNAALIKAGEAVLPWSFQREDEWVFCRIVKAELKLGRKEKRPVYVTVEVLTGSPAGEKVVEQYSSSGLSYIAKYRTPANKGFGFQKSRVTRRGEEQATRLYETPEQLNGLLCYRLASRKMSRETLVLTTFEHSTMTEKRNKEEIARVLEVRARSQKLRN